LANLSTLPIIQAADNVGGRIVAFWCRCGDLRSITDPENKVTTWIRDETRRVNFKIYPDLKQAAHTYEPLSGRLATMTDMSQQVTTRRYFADSSLKDLAYTNAIIPTPTVSFTYDAFFSRIETMSDGIGTTSYNYHPPGQNGALQVHTEDGPLTGDTDKITYTYDDLGRLKTRNIGPLGSENLVTLHYDGLGRLDDLTDTLGLFDYAYVGESSRLDYVSYPNGQKTDYDYYGATADHRLKQIKNLADGTNPASVLSQFDYTFFDDGKIHTIARQLGGGIPTDKYTFGYDDADQLETATLVKQSDNSPLKAFAYSYDPSANITSISRTKGSAAAQVTTFIPNDRNQITSMSGPRPQLVQGYTNEPSNVTINGTRADNADHNQFTGKIDAAPGANTVTATATDMSANANTTTQSWDIDVPATQLFSYDANGNLLSDGTRSYTWDAVNRLASVSMGVDTWTFGYDGLDRRVTESKNGTLMNKWLWCGTGICEERAPNDAVTKRYFTHGEERIGDWDAGEYFYTSDHLGSIRDVTATVGGSVVTVARYDFDPYGERQKLTGTTSYTCDFGFTGHHTHAATGLVLTLYRAYDPSLGVWLSADPIGEGGGLNLYGYVTNDPVNYLDYLGLDKHINLLCSRSKEGNYLKSDPDYKGAILYESVAAASAGIHISAHGNSNAIYDDRKSIYDGRVTERRRVGGKRLNASAVAKGIIKLTKKDGTDYGRRVTVHACNTGNGENSFAQQLVNELKELTGKNWTVSAPNNFTQVEGTLGSARTVVGDMTSSNELVNKGGENRYVDFTPKAPK
jgi:RHS repeat-associated protein